MHTVTAHKKDIPALLKPKDNKPTPNRAVYNPNQKKKTGKKKKKPL
jgi:hypothetical protein